MEIVFYSDQIVWDPADPSHVIQSFLTSELPICLCTQLADVDTNSPTGFLAQRGYRPTRIVKPLQGVTIIDVISWPGIITTPEEFITVMTNAVDTQGTKIEAMLNVFQFASSGSAYSNQVFCFYGPIDLTGCSIQFTAPHRPVLLKTPVSPYQVLVSSTFDATKIMADALSDFTAQVDSTRVQVQNGLGYLVSLNLVNDINLDNAIKADVQTYPLDVWSQVLRQYLEDPFPRRSKFPTKMVIIVALVLVLLTLQLRALSR